jgi:hypothetical protein
MKLIQRILGVALLAALMTFATGKAQANNVIDGVLYAALNVKVTATYIFNNHYVKLNLTNKQIFEILGLPKNTKLMVNVETGDVWVFASVGSFNLTADGYLTVSTQVISSTLLGGTETDVGTVALNFYGHPQFSGGLDQGASEAASNNWFEIGGIFTLKHSDGALNSKGFFKASYAFSAASLTGRSVFSGVENNIVPMIGGISAKGSGSVPKP